MNFLYFKKFDQKINVIENNKIANVTQVIETTFSEKVATNELKNADPINAIKLFEKGKITLISIGDYFFNLLKLRMGRKSKDEDSEAKASKTKAPKTKLSKIRNNSF